MITEKVLNSIKPTTDLKSTKATIYMYQATSALSLEDKFITMIKSQYQQILTTIHVVQVYEISILGRATS